MSKHLKFDTGKNLLETGFSIMVVDRDKRPCLKWAGLRENPWRADELQGWIDKPNAWRYGLLTGVNNLFCIDVDLKVIPDVDERREFFAEFTQYLRDHVDGFDKKVAIYPTLNFGYHIVYRTETDMGNKKLAKRAGEKEALIETRGVGGYIVVYDEPTNGTRYSDLEILSKEDHDIMIGIAEIYNDPDVQPVEEIKISKRAKAAVDGITPWQDYNDRHSMMEVVGGDLQIVRSIQTRHIVKRNGAKTPHSGYIYRDSGCMYLFSTGTVYPNETLISPFAAMTYRDHGGNFSEAAKWAYHKGYGARIQSRKPEVRSIEIPSTEDRVDHDFPIGVFPTEVQDYLKECNRTLDSSIDYMGVSVLWLLSMIVGNSIKVRVKNGWTETGIVWISVVGKAGLGKTPSIDNIVRPLMNENSREVKTYIRQYAKFKEYDKLEAKEKKNRHEEVREPVKKQFIVGDTTLEALVELHEENPNAVGVFKDELAGWMKDMNKYREGSDVEFWLSSWSNKPVAMNRKTVKNTYVHSPVVPVLGGIQPGILNELFTFSNKENGFIDRMLLSYPDLTVEKYNDAELNLDLIRWYDEYVLILKKKLDDMLQIDGDGDITSHTVNFSSGAKKEWARVFNKITRSQNSDSENEYMKSMLPKQKSYIPRFALLLHVLHSYHNDDNLLSEISTETIKRAEQLSDYFVAMAMKLKLDSAETLAMRAVVNDVKKGSGYDKLKAIIKASPSGKFNKTRASEELQVSRTTIHEWAKKIAGEK